MQLHTLWRDGSSAEKEQLSDERTNSGVVNDQLSGGQTLH
jgi:hypothetical protein